MLLLRCRRVFHQGPVFDHHRASMGTLDGKGEGGNTWSPVEGVRPSGGHSVVQPPRGCEAELISSSDSSE